MRWACTVKREYFDAIKRGQKKYEVRRRVPRLMKGDILYICCGDEVVRCEVVFLLRVRKEKAWFMYQSEMCIDEYAYLDYVQGVDEVGLIRLRVEGDVVGEELLRFRSAVRRNPQWFSKVHFR